LKHISTILLFLFLQNLSAQNTFQAQIKSDNEQGELLQGVTAHVIGTEIAAIADSSGRILLQNIPDGEQTIEFSLLGYFKKKIKINFPQPKNAAVTEVKLQTQAEEIDEVIITTTRNYQKAEYVPVTVEVVNEAEVEERSHDKPSDVSHVLREQPGVQVQRTSATAGTMSIRLQGLNSRYVQLLKDGFPLFGGFSNVIGITQIPPLDLKQVEIIKGPSSTLYGGDAIAGVINLISKVPTEKPVYDLMFNGESANAYDAGLYAAQKFKWFAFSLTGAYRWQFAKDWDGDHFTETPKLQRYNISPQLFFDLSKHARLNVGANYTKEDRLGGTVEYIRHEPDSTYNYFENNVSEHISSNFKFEYDFEKNGKLTLKNAINYFTRELTIPHYLFKGKQLASASEINYHFIRRRHDVVVGIDFRQDQFAEAADSSPVKRDYTYLTFGAFAQYLYNFSDKTTLQLGFRFDYNNIYKAYPLPNLAIRQKWNDIFSTRLNIGMGYKLPTVFQDESEYARFRGVQPITFAVKPELSLGGTLGLIVKLPNFNGLNISITQLYFLTHIFRPLLAQTITDSTCLDCSKLNYANANGYIQSGGVETGMQLSYRGIGLSLVYTLTDNNRKIDNVRSIAPLTSKHIISILAGYEIKNFYVGIDAYYYSPVKLSDGSVGRQIWELGVNVQYGFKYLLLFANFENLADIRQTSYGPTVFPDPTYSHPRFSEIYAPLEGRLINVGFKLRLGAFAKRNKGNNEGVERIRNKEN
jgi:outer membrane receptor for ferrienterochelin and colicins